MTTPAHEDLTLLARRAAALATPFEERAEDAGLDLLLVTVGGQQLAIPLADVREVRPPRPVAQVPRSGAALVGVVGGHGDALPVASLEALLGLPDGLPPNQQWVVVLGHLTSPLGLLADTVVDIVTVSREDLAPATDSAGLISALLRDGAAVLDTPTVLSDTRLSLLPSTPTEEPAWQRT